MLQSGYEYTLAEAHACSETSAFVAFDPAAVLSPPESRVQRIEQNASGPVAFSIGAHKTPSRRTSVQALGATTTLTFHVEITQADTPLAVGTGKCSKDSLRLGRLWALLHWSRRLPGISQV